MLEGRRIWVVGGAIIVVALALMFLTYLTSMVFASDYPNSGSHQRVNVPLGILSMTALSAGLGFLVVGARRKMNVSPEARMTFLAMAAFFILSLVLLFTVFNPLISPYGAIRDSDLDGYTDDIDNYPHDKSRHFAPYIQLTVSWGNTSTNYSATVTNVGFIRFPDEPLTLSDIVLSAVWYSTSYFAHVEDVAPLDELSEAWIHGATFIDRAPLNELSANDTFSFDTTVFNVAFEPFLRDDVGYTIAAFTTF